MLQLFALLTAALVSRPASIPPVESPVAIVGGTLITGLDDTQIRESAVIFENGRIIYAGKLAGAPIPQNAQIVDAKNRWLIPGLIDMHVHLDEVITPEMFLKFGVTSVRDVGSRLVTIQRWRAKHSVPHIFWMGRNIDEGTPSWWGAVAVKGPAQVPGLLDDMVNQGVDGVKLYVNAGPDVARSVIEQAHERGMPVTAHPGKTSPKRLSEDGIDNIEHVSQLFLDLCDASTSVNPGYFAGYKRAAETDLYGPRTKALVATLNANHTAITPTLTVSIMPLDKNETRRYAGWTSVPPRWRNEWKRSYWDFISTKGWTTKQMLAADSACSNYRKLVTLLYRAGVPLIAGTDTPAPNVLPGAGLLVELELMGECGIPPVELIRSATSRAASILRREDDVGAIAAGRCADILVLTADPTKDIKNLHKIERTYHDGHRVKR